MAVKGFKRRREEGNGSPLSHSHGADLGTDKASFLLYTFPASRSLAWLTHEEPTRTTCPILFIGVTGMSGTRMCREPCKGEAGGWTKLGSVDTEPAESKTFA